MYVFPALISLIVIVTLYVHFQLQLRHNVDSIKTYLDLFQSIITILGVFVAIYWYFIERSHYPHINIDQHIEVAAIGNGMAVVKVDLNIKNDGNIVVQVGEPWSFLGLADVNDPPVDEEINDQFVSSYALSKWPNDLYDHGIIRWKINQLYDPDNRLPCTNLAKTVTDKCRPYALDKRAIISIEPNENHRVYIEFILKCDQQAFVVMSGIEREGERDGSHPDGLHSAERDYIVVDEQCRSKSTRKEE